jgi:proteic killer suppression protein
MARVSFGVGRQSPPNQVDFQRKSERRTLVAQCATNRLTARSVLRYACCRSVSGAVTIQSWASDEAEIVFKGRSPGKGFPQELVQRLRRRLQQLDAAVALEDMKSPPGNCLHELDGDRKGQWSVSVNDQFRITFKWGDAGPEEVWFGDYH